jgi:hypothetical protein
VLVDDHALAGERPFVGKKPEVAIKIGRFSRALYRAGFGRRLELAIGVECRPRFILGIFPGANRLDRSKDAGLSLFSCESRIVLSIDNVEEFRLQSHALGLWTVYLFS